MVWNSSSIGKDSKIAVKQKDLRIVKLLVLIGGNTCGLAATGKFLGAAVNIICSLLFDKEIYFGDFVFNKLISKIFQDTYELKLTKISVFEFHT